VKKIIKLGTPEFLELLKEWNRKLGPEFNEINSRVALTGWTFDMRSAVMGSTAPGEFTDRTVGLKLTNTPEFQVAEKIADEAAKLNPFKRHTPAIQEWAQGNSSISAVAKKHKIHRDTLRCAVHGFLKSIGILRNPWGRYRSGRDKDPFSVAGPVKHVIKNGRPVDG
jgi:hypothetical protein